MRLPSAKRVLDHILLLAGNQALYRPPAAAKRKLSSQKLKFWKNYPWTKTSLRVLCSNQIGRWILYMNQWKKAKFISIDQNGLELLPGNLSRIQSLPEIFHHFQRTSGFERHKAYHRRSEIFIQLHWESGGFSNWFCELKILLAETMSQPNWKLLSVIL